MILVVSLLVALASPAFAAPIEFWIDGNAGVLYSGNDCAGVFGGNFEECVSPSGSPIIAKYDGKWEVSSLFPSVTGVEWTFDTTMNFGAGWTYTPGPGDPVITSFVWEQANGFTYFPLIYTENPLGRDVQVRFVAGSLPYQDTSHLSFYDTAHPVPEPGSMSLLGIGLMFCGRLLRKGWGLQR
jgi:hypothetical protein